MEPLLHQVFYTYRRNPKDPLPPGWTDEIYEELTSPSWVFSVLDDRVLYHLVIPQSSEDELPAKGLLAPGIWGAVHALTVGGWQYSSDPEATSRARSAISLTLGRHPLFYLDGGARP